MLKISKDELVYDYEWENPANAEKLFEEQKMIDLRDGYGILKYINNISSRYGLSSKNTLLKIEDLLHKLPQGIYHKKQLDSYIGKKWDAGYPFQPMLLLMPFMALSNFT